MHNNYIKILGLSILFCLISKITHSATPKELSHLYLDSVYIYANYTYTDSVEASKLKNRLIQQMKADNYIYTATIDQLYTALSEEANGRIDKSRLTYNQTLKSLNNNYKVDSDALNIYFTTCLYYSNMEMIEYNYMKSLRILYNLELELKKTKPEWLVEVYNNIASIYSELEEQFLFKKYLNKASEIVRQSAPLETYLTVRLNEASALYSANNYQLSLKQLDSFKDSIYMHENTYLDLEEMYWCLYALNSYELNYINKAKEALKVFYTIDTKDPYFRAKALMLEVTMNSKTNHDNKLQSKINESYHILKSYDNPHLMKDYYTMMQNVYAHNKDSLIKYYQSYMQYEDSVRHLSHSSIMLDMENQQALYDIDAEFKSISKELDYQKQISKTKTLIITLVAVILLLILAIAYLVWKRNIRLNKQIKQLVSNNHALYKIKDGTTQKISKNTPSESLSTDNAQILIQGWEEIVLNQKRYTDQQINLGQIAKELNTNTSYLSALINTKYGKNFNKLINQYRIKEALHLLHKNDMHLYTIEHIANKSGFRSMSSFYSVFKETTGATPKQYLNELKKQLVE